MPDHNADRPLVFTAARGRAPVASRPNGFVEGGRPARYAPHARVTFSRAAAIVPGRWGKQTVSAPRPEAGRSRDIRSWRRVDLNSVSAETQRRDATGPGLAWDWRYLTGLVVRLDTTCSQRADRAVP